MQSKFQSIISIALSAFAAVTLTSNTLAAGPLDLTKQELPVETIGSLVFFNGEFFRSSPGYSGVWSSPDGKSWTKRHPLSHAKGLLISTGQELVLPYWFPSWNTQVLFRSPNGENWTGTPLPIWVNLSDLAYGNDAFVGIPRGTGLAWRSAAAIANGTEWLRVSTNLVFQSVDFLNTNFLAWAYDQSDVSARFLGSSADGLDWTFTPLPPNWKTDVADMTYGNGVFVAVGRGIAMLSTPDDIQALPPFADTSFSDVLFDGTKFIAVGEKIVYSSDGRNWTEAANVANRYLQSIAFGNSLYLITGDHTVLSSRDGTNWVHEHPTLSEISAVSYGNDRFVAFGEGANGRIALLSTNENKWSPVALPPGTPITTSTYAQDRFIAFSESNVITSVDGVTWDTMLPDLNGTPMAAQFANGEYFLAVQDGPDGRLYRGAALTDLNATVTFDNSSLRALVVSGPTIIVAGGVYPQATVLHVSIDSGASWQAIPTLNPIRALASGNGRFVAAGDYSYVMSSTNALQWQEKFLTNTWFRALAFGGNSFIAAGSLGLRNGPAPRGIWSSTDGETWIAHPVPAVGDVDAIAFGGTEWVLVGPYGLVLRSAPVGPFFRSEQLFATQQTLALTIDNTPGQRAILESSPDLRNWTEVTNSTDQSFSIEVPRNLPGQFYRLRE